MILGFLLDCIIGDPYSFPHPIKLIGRLISALEKSVRKHFSDLRKGGAILAVTVVVLSTAAPLGLLILCYSIHVLLGIAAETVLCCYMLAARCLCKESMKVCKAAVETVAENTSDGVTAPLFYMGLGGAVGGFFYKSVNTMDSMIGYTDEKYADIGRFAAKLDDVLNYIPSRLTALLMVAIAPFLGLDGRNAFRIWKRDRRNHASPNSAQTESACAGALHLRLAGDAWYFGKLHKKPYIGDNDRPVDPADIRRANRLMYGVSVLMLIISAAARCAIFGGFL